MLTNKGCQYWLDLAHSSGKEDQADMEAFNLFDTVKDDPEKIVDDHCPNTIVGFQSTGEGGSIIPPPIGGLPLVSPFDHQQ